MDSNKSCTFIESRTKYKGHFLSFMESDFEVTDKEKKSKITWEYVQYNHNLSSNIKFGVTIIPIIKKSNKIVIISNYRYAVKKCCLEFPSGLIEQKDENNNKDIDTIIKNTAKRELKEETGYDGEFLSYMTLPNINDSIKVMSNVYYDPWKSNDCSSFCIFDLKEKEQQSLDNCEIIKVFEVDIDNLLDFITEKIKTNQFACSADLYSFSFGLKFKSVLDKYNI